MRKKNKINRVKHFYLICFTCLFYQIGLSQTPPFKVNYSEPLSVYVFVEQLSNKTGLNEFKRLFFSSKYNQEKYTSLLAQFDTLILNYAYEFPEYPYGSIVPGMTESLIKKNLVSSVNLKDFKQLTAGIIPNENLFQLSAILYEFQEVYRNLIYKPNKSKFDKQLVEINTYVKTKKIATFFEDELLFYKTYWDESVPFQISFYPVLDSQGFSASAFCNNAVCGLKVNTKDYSIILGVLMHEISHILYNEQTLELKQSIMNWCNSSPFNSSTYAYLLLNEVLATAIGNGYIVESLTGKKDETDWYNRKYIDLMAKKIYPLVSEYMRQKKAIDQVFISSYINLYEESFPEWLNEMDNLMCYRYVLSDNKNDFNVIQKNYPYASFSTNEDVVDEVAIERMKKYPLTKMIIVSENNEVKLELIKSKFKEIAEIKFKAKSDFIYSCLLLDRTKLILINNVKGSTEKALNGRVMLPPETIK